MAGFALPGGYFLGDVAMRRELASYLHLLNLAGGASFRTPRGGVIDGYATNPGDIDAAGSTNEEYGTKFWTSTRTSTQTFVVTGLSTAGADAYANLTNRAVIPASAITASGSACRITIQGGSGEGTAFTNVYLGRAADSGDAYDFFTTPTQVTFNGGQTSITLAAGASATSDVINLAIDETKNYVLAYFIGGSTPDTIRINTVAGGSSWYKTGLDATTQNATGYTQSGAANAIFSLTSIDVLSDYNDLTLVSNAYTVSSAPAQAYLLGIVDWGAASPTLNTDLIAAVSRNNGSNWSNVTLVNRGVIQGTRRIVDGVVTLSGQPSGTQLKTRWLTDNGVQFSLYGVALEI